MLAGKTPEITIKFSQKPYLPTEGKKVVVEIVGENNIKVKTELNRKTLKKQVDKMEGFSSWVGALSGKIKSISPTGLIELEKAGLQVFETKQKEQNGKSDKEGAKTRVQQQQTLNTEDPQVKAQIEKENKIQELIAKATRPRDKAFYQNLLDKAIASRPLVMNLTISNSSAAPTELVEATNTGASSVSKQASTSSGEQTKEQETEQPVIFQAVGLLSGLITAEEKKLKITIDENIYTLRFAPGYKRKIFERLKSEIIEQGSQQKNILVYPQFNITKKGEEKLGFLLSNYKSVDQNYVAFTDREFKLSGIWQYLPDGERTCITIRRNYSEDFLSVLEKMNDKQKANLLQPMHLPLLWANPSVEPYTSAVEEEEETKKPYFVTLKAVFVVEENKFKVIEELAEPSLDIPRYFE